MIPFGAAMGASFETVIERRDPELPLDLPVPAELVAGCRRDANSVVRATRAGRGRRAHRAPLRAAAGRAVAKEWSGVEHADTRARRVARALARLEPAP
ncbi:MAG: hypothetical protein GVY33_10520 [Alphaproteobacteria bacterium]|jgi:hypothetical protein|nr:hypothetical protein [Alphaproteobacteria bacterium]